MLSLSISTGYAQFDIPEKPSLQTSVYDYSNLFNNTQKKALENKLIRYSDSTSTQIVIITIASTNGEHINYLGAQWGEKWGIGQENKDNGILILLAKNDKRIGINTGKGVEHLLTDALSKRIINNDIIPYFKLNDYYGGLNNAADIIFKVLTGEYKNTKTASTKKFPISVIFLILFFIILIIAISKKNGRGGGNRGNRGNTAADILEAIILSNMGRGSYSRKSSGGFGGFGGSSGGGFSGGFGGGSFGGGGASGGW